MSPTWVPLVVVAVGALAYVLGAAVGWSNDGLGWSLIWVGRILIAVGVVWAVVILSGIEVGFRHTG